jgi:hypothetical protein
MPLDDQRRHQSFLHLHQGWNHALGRGSAHRRSGQTFGQRISRHPVEHVALDQAADPTAGPGANEEAGDEADGNDRDDLGQVGELDTRWQLCSERIKGMLETARHFREEKDDRRGRNDNQRTAQHGCLDELDRLLHGLHPFWNAAAISAQPPRC